MIFRIIGTMAVLSFLWMLMGGVVIDTSEYTHGQTTLIAVGPLVSCLAAFLIGLIWKGVGDD